MKKNLLLWPVIAGIVAAFGISSCAYDPYYSSVSGSYSSGYGYGHGYGGSGFSTSLFVSTGDPRWGYDPYNYCYYDYRSRRYYDPYLYGYYPVGYRPPVLVGVPHPYGWRRGSGYCPPPKVVRNVTVVNYRDRASAYRRSNHGWAKNVRINDDSRGYDASRGSRDGYRRDSGPSGIWSRDWLNPGSRRDDGRGTRDSLFAPSGRSTSREARPPSSYQSPVTRRESVQPRNFSDSRQSRSFERNIRRPQPPAASREVRQAPQPQFRSPSRRPEAAPSRQFTPQRDPGFRGGGNPQPQSRPQAPPRPEPSRGNGGEGRRGLRSLGDA